METPDWFLEEERRLLELTATLADLQKEVRRVRHRVLSRMEEEGIRRIDSGLSVCSVVRGSVHHVVDVRKLKKEFPLVWNECQKERNVGHRLLVRLK